MIKTNECVVIRSRWCQCSRPTQRTRTTPTSSRVESETSRRCHAQHATTTTATTPTLSNATANTAQLTSTAPLEQSSSRRSSCGSVATTVPVGAATTEFSAATIGAQHESVDIESRSGWWRTNGHTREHAECSHESKSISTTARHHRRDGSRDSHVLLE